MDGIGYIGTARNSEDIDAALLLATRVFRSEEGFTDAALNTKKDLLSPNGILLKEDVVVIMSKSGEISAACFLIDRVFYRERCRLQGTYLSSICVSPSYRNKGLSILLMNTAINECERRGSLFALVIARRFVDHFYNKFNFWGISQYAKINLSFSKNDHETQSYTMRSTNSADLIEINKMYVQTYLGLYGSSVRSADYWEYILWKAKIQKIKFSSFSVNNNIAGYAIHSGDDVFELSVKPQFSYMGILKKIASYDNLERYQIHSTEKHPIVNEFHYQDFTISKRQCSYGGHMIRLIDPVKLLSCLEEEFIQEANKAGISQYEYQSDGKYIKISEGEAKITIHGSVFDFSNTYFLMKAEILSERNNFGIFNFQSFNIPLFDQI